MTRPVSVQFIYLFGVLLCIGTGVTSRRTLFDPKGIEQDLSGGRADNTTFACPGTGNYPIPGKECTENYYSCATGTPVPAVCAGASIFEPSTSVCTSTSTAACKNSTTSPVQPNSTTTTTQISTTAIETTRPTTTTTTTPIVTTPNAPFVCQENGAFPNPSNCNTFYMCSNGIAYLYLCPSNLVFNHATGNCDYASNVSGPCADAL